MSWVNPVDYTVGQATCVARLDGQVLGNLDHLGVHDHSGSAGEGGSLSGSVAAGTGALFCARNYVTLMPYFPASATTGHSTTVTGAPGGGGLRMNIGAGASARFLVDLVPGVWNWRFFHSIGPNFGIVSGCMGGTLIGSVDMYDAGGNNAILSAASQFTLSSSGAQVFKLELTGSNVSSGGYDSIINLIELHRVSG